MVGVQLDILDTHNNIVLLDAILVDTENSGPPPTPPLPPPLPRTLHITSQALYARECSRPSPLLTFLTPLPSAPRSPPFRSSRSSLPLLALRPSLLAPLLTLLALLLTLLTLLLALLLAL